MNIFQFVNLPSIFFVSSVVIAGFIVGGSNIRKSLQIARDTCIPMGIVATLIGFIKMLSSLDAPSSIGPAIAVAFISTLYAFILFTFLDALYSLFPDEKHSSLSDTEIDSLMMKNEEKLTKSLRFCLTILKNRPKNATSFSGQ